MKKLNLLINYDCPLNCRYCCQREMENLEQEFLTYDEIYDYVKRYREIAKAPVRVNISGGEPLLRFDDIKKLIEAFPDNKYLISTSGFLLTKEYLEFFSHYTVDFVLSVDGHEALTKYLRRSNSYFQKLREIVPTLLYYFPRVRAKLIISKNLIDQIYPTYLALEQLGFRYIFITPNVYENTVDNIHPELKTGDWLEEDWNLFNDQINLIANQIIEGAAKNVFRCGISNIYAAAIRILYPNYTLSPDRMICPVLDLKVGITPTVREFDPLSTCLKSKTACKTQAEVLEKAYKDFPAIEDKCPHNPNCEFYNACCHTTCIAQNAKETGSFFVPSLFQCYTQQVFFNAAMKILTNISNMNTEESELLLFQFKKEGDYQCQLEPNPNVIQP